MKHTTLGALPLLALAGALAGCSERNTPTAPSADAVALNPAGFIGDRPYTWTVKCSGGSSASWSWTAGGVTIAGTEASTYCTSTATGTLHQLREAWINRSHADADEWLYVVAGEATMRVSGSEQRLQAGTFSLIPHTVVYSVVPAGRNPFIVVSILTGPACAP